MRRWPWKLFDLGLVCLVVFVELFLVVGLTVTAPPYEGFNVLAHVLLWVILGGLNATIISDILKSARRIRSP